LWRIFFTLVLTSCCANWQNCQYFFGRRMQCHSRFRFEYSDWDWVDSPGNAVMISLGTTDLFHLTVEDWACGLIYSASEGIGMGS